MRRNQELAPTRREFSQGLSPIMGAVVPAGFYGSPWQAMRRMQEDLDHLFGQVVEGQKGQGGGLLQATQQWAPSMDVSETDKEWRIEADLPGVTPEDIDVQLHEGVLTLRAEMRQEDESPIDEQGNIKQGNGNQAQQSGQRRYHHRERRYGFFERVLTLPENVDQDQVQCDFKDGVLTLHIPKVRPAVSEPRRIAIGRGSQRGHSSESTNVQANQQSSADTQTTQAQSAQEIPGTEEASNTGGKTGKHQKK